MKRKTKKLIKLVKQLNKLGCKVLELLVTVTLLVPAVRSLMELI